MFDSEVERDPQSKRLTRRVFVAGAMGVVGAAAVLRMTRSPGVEASMEVHGIPGQVALVRFGDDGKRLGEETVAKVVKTDGAWYEQLGRNSYGIARHADTEMPFFGVSWKEHRRGIYRCLGCETALFSSDTKFDSGTGWPSFWAPLAKQNVTERADTSMGITRTEVTCARCDGHLGHVFHDGPAPTGLRYCMNSASMRFVAA